MLGLEALITEQSEYVLRIVRLIMKFTQKCVDDLNEGSLTADYSEQEFPLPASLKDYIKNNVILQDSSLIQAYLVVLQKPNRIDLLIESYMHSFIIEEHSYTDFRFIDWGVNCCFISAELYRKGFREAPDIAVETVRGMCFLYNRYDAFRKLGCRV